MSSNHSKVPRFEPGHNHLVIVFHIVISFFFSISKKVVAEVLKIPVFSQIWTRIAEFKLQIAIHFTIEKNNEDGIRIRARKAQRINSPSP